MEIVGREIVEASVRGKRADSALRGRNTDGMTRGLRCFFLINS